MAPIDTESISPIERRIAGVLLLLAGLAAAVALLADFFEPRVIPRSRAAVAFLACGGLLSIVAIVQGARLTRAARTSRTLLPNWALGVGVVLFSLMALWGLVIAIAAWDIAGLRWLFGSLFGLVGARGAYHLLRNRQRGDPDPPSPFIGDEEDGT